MKGNIDDLIKKPLTEQEVKSLNDDRISKNDYDRIIARISVKTEEIWKYIISKSGRKLTWWAFRNDRSYRDGDGSDGGFYQPDEDFDYITIIGENTHCSYIGYQLNDSFPTEFLWTDYKEWVDAHVDVCRQNTEKAKELLKKEREEWKGKRKSLIESIKKKLTKEELAIVSFIK